MKARLIQIRLEAEGVHAYRFEPLPGETLPPFEAGAHVNVTLGDGITRSYSLLNDPADPSFYEIAVHLSPTSRGGSRYIHEHWHVGLVVDMTDPSNNFPLDETAAHSVMIAGGIGITPLLSMIDRLDAIGRPWELHYVAQSPERAAFVRHLSGRDNVHVQFDGIEGGQPLDLRGVVEAAPADAHLYCCGPQGMLDAYKGFAAGRPKGHVHLEYFTADTQIATEGGFVVELAKSGKSFEIKEGDRILDVLLDNGVDVPFACSEGTCGTCETRVIEGTPDHRDFFLTDDERASGEMMMVCCSGCKSDKLVLDL
ncbi:PDR/VanB family oxidoreductase [Mesobacterium pallidum]|uniref:PDR/VanB family oxidoreductase n=1 Tax=Mesobacterium pallidum TaxID=2872037 RepID=UPI001EE1B9CB|nr:PDR/VanB family oxidoreductase [Mesobacterium pallidum]